jgi:hypothetical protein
LASKWLPIVGDYLYGIGTMQHHQVNKQIPTKQRKKLCEQDENTPMQLTAKQLTYQTPSHTLETIQV